MSSGARRPTLPSGSRHRHRAARSFTLTLTTALLCTMAPPPVEAQSSKARTDAWVASGGTVEASTTMVTVREGERASYRLRLTRPLPTDESDNQVSGWWVMVHIPGATRTENDDYDIDGDGVGDVHLMPSQGWEFDPSDWPAGQDESHWRDVTIEAREDGDEEDLTFTIVHEVRDEDSYCPDALHPDRLPQVAVRVVDDDGPNAPKPELSIGDASVEEGGTAGFRVTLDTESENPVTVRYRTSNGTARAGSDYEAVDDTLTIPAEMKIGFIDVVTTEDDDYEVDETFTVTLSSPVGATIGDGTGEGTITDDDSKPTLSIGDAAVDEGDTAEFEVTLSGARAVTATVQYSTMDGTAVMESDYTAINGTLTFRPGDNSETIRVRTREDSTRENQETFSVVLSDPQEATISTGTGTGTINDDDAGAQPSLRIQDATVTEGGTASFQVTLSATPTETVTVAYETRDGVARAGSDYITASDTLTFTTQDPPEPDDTGSYPR